MLGDEIVTPLVHLCLAGRSATEIVDQQSVVTRLQEAASTHLGKVLEARRQLTSLSHESFARRGDESFARRGDESFARRGDESFARRGDLAGQRVSTSGSSSRGVLGGGGVLGGDTGPPGIKPPTSPARLPRVERPPSRGTGLGGPAPAPAAMEDGISSSTGRRNAKYSASTPNLRADGRFNAKIGGGGRAKFSKRLDPLGDVDPLLRESIRAQQAADTPDAIWDELCRTLREL